MNNHLNTKKNIIIVLIFTLAIIGFIIVMLEKTNNDDYLIRCTSFAIIKKNQMEARVTIDFRLNRENKGKLAYSGELTSSDNKNYILSRDIVFDYDKTTGSSITMSNYKTRKNVTDNAPNLLVDQLVHDSKRDQNKYFIYKKGMVYLINDDFTPLFACMQK